ncbi:MAG: hypothetical protein Q8R92_10020, partial [Deltaproteobacteria bacterium]|nr:hypothetical protein [Deltaproteobacteria bacterium]
MADGLKITVEFKTEPVTRFLERVIRDQIPFASALALTRTAQDARDSVIAGLDSKFILRNNWVKGGIRA